MAKGAYKTLKNKIAFLTFSTLHIFLSAVFLVNIAQLGYHSPLKNAECETIHLTLISPTYDELLLYISCSTMIALALLTKSWKLNKELFAVILTSAFTSASTIYFGAHVTSQFFAVLAGLFSLILTLRLHSVKRSIKVIESLKWQALTLLSLLIAIEVSSTIVWLLAPCNPQIINSWLWGIVQLETQLFHTPEFLLTPLFLATAFSWILLAFKSRLKKIKSIKLRFTTGIESILIYDRTGLERVSDEKSSKINILLLITSLTLTTLFVCYPYLHQLAPENYVGVDVPYYVSWLNYMDAQDGLIQAVNRAFHIYDRSISLLFMYCIWKFFRLPLLNAVKFMPILLGLLFTLSVYFFASKFIKNHCVEGLTALLASFSYTLTVGIICAFFANWLALSLAYLFSVFLVSCMNKPSLKLVIATLATSAALLYTHAFTWAMFIGIAALTLIYTILESLKRKKLSKEFKVLSIILAFNITLDSLKNMLTPIATSSIIKTVSLAQRTFSTQNVLNFWSLAYQDLTGAMLGFFINPPIMMLAFVGVLSITLNEDNNLNRYLISALVASSIAFMLGEWLIHVRILYNMPLIIYAAIGLQNTFLSNENKGKTGLIEKVKALSLILLVFMEINYSLRCGFAASQHVRKLTNAVP
jgi:hypothetical protein